MSVKTAVTTLILAGVSYVEASSAIGYTNVSVTAVTSSPAISVSVVSGSSDVTYVDPVFALSYLEPKVATTYLEVDVLAVPSKPAVIQVDVVNPLDNTIFGVAKNIQELVSATEAKAVSFSGSLEDQVYLAESFIPRRFISRLFTDTYSLVDASTIGFGASYTDLVTTSEDINTVDISKVLQDTAVSLDITAAAITKVLSDYISPTDIYASDVLKVLAESVSSIDVFSRTIDFDRAFTSAITLIELATSNTGKNLADSTSATEYYVVDFSSVRQDSATTTDNAELVNQFFRTFSDTVSSAENKTILFGKVFADLVTIQDAVSAAVQYNTFLSDNILLSDTVVTAVPIVRTFTDSFTMNEYLSKLNEAPLNSFVVGGKYGGETVVVALNRVAPPITDTTGTSDSGMWVLQDYTSADYFAEDYVGTKGTI